MSALSDLSGRAAATAGRALYQRWSGTSEFDRARHWDRLSPADQVAWEHLAAWHDADKRRHAAAVVARRERRA